MDKSLEQLGQIANLEAQVALQRYEIEQLKEALSDANIEIGTYQLAITVALDIEFSADRHAGDYFRLIYDLKESDEHKA